MITEDYVPFKTAKLLKEKGFDEVCKTAYETITQKHEVEPCYSSDWGKLNQIKRPTLQMAMKWLREVYKITIGIVFNGDRIYYEIHQNNEFVFGVDTPKSYEKVCDEAIKYCLENLI